MTFLYTQNALEGSCKYLGYKTSALHMSFLLCYILRNLLLYTEMSAQTISRLRTALSAKHLIARQKHELQREAAFLKKQLAQLEALYKARNQEKADMESRQARMDQELETYREFAREPKIRQRLTDFLQEQQAAELQRQEEERQRAAIAEQDQPHTLRMR